MRNFKPVGCVLRGASVRIQVGNLLIAIRPTEQFMRERLQPWAAVVFCAMLCAITLIASIVGVAIGNSSFPGSLIAFLCFLPMCFFFASTQIVQMQREMQELRQRIAMIEGPPKN